MEAFLVAKVLFWLLGVGIAVLPLRWAFLSYLVVMHIDLSGPLFASSTSVGVENLLKVIGLPLILLFRTRFKPLRNAKITLAFILWTMLILYATLTTFWSPFLLSGVKMVFYLYAYLVVFLIFVYGWSEGWIDDSLVVMSLWLVLGLAILQTYVLGNPFGEFKIVKEFRFTSFTHAQGFAGYLIAVLAIILFSKRTSLIKTISIGAILVGVILTGSRYVFFGMTFLFFFAWLNLFFKKDKLQNRPLDFAKMLFAPAFVVFSIVAIANFAPDNRLSQFVESNNGGSEKGVGTFIWRLGIYERALDIMPDRDLFPLLFGSGTSSGAQLVIGYDSRYSEDSIDANRVVHSDFIRTFYEWGLLGGFTFLSFLGASLISYLNLAMIKKSTAALAFIGIFPNLLFGLAIENILTASSSPDGIGIILVMAYGAAAKKNDEENALTLYKRRKKQEFKVHVPSLNP
jgi:O-Antigen ligase